MINLASPVCGGSGKGGGGGCKAFVWEGEGGAGGRGLQDVYVGEMGGCDGDCVKGLTPNDADKESTVHEPLATSLDAPRPNA